MTVNLGPQHPSTHGVPRCISRTLIGHSQGYIRLFYGITGLLSRSAKIGIDARFTGHELHHKLSYTLYLSSSGV